MAYRGFSLCGTIILEQVLFLGNNKIYLNNLVENNNFEKFDYITNIINLRSIYNTKEVARFQTFIRLRDWQPTVFNVSTNEVKTQIIEDAYYKIIRIIDNFEVVGFGTGTMNHTRMSFDSNGNYFDFDCSILEPRVYLRDKICLF